MEKEWKSFYDRCVPAARRETFETFPGYEKKFPGVKTMINGLTKTVEETTAHIKGNIGFFKREQDTKPVLYFLDENKKVYTAKPPCENYANAG